MSKSNIQIWRTLNTFQKSVLGAISYYGGYDIFDEFGLFDTLNSGKFYLTIEDLKKVNDLNSALNFYRAFVESDERNWYDNHDSIEIKDEKELAEEYSRNVDESEKMLINALTNNKDIFEIIEESSDSKDKTLISETGSKKK